MSCEHRFDDAAYVLGALPPDERTRFEEHLTACQSCRAAVAELAGLPGVLAHAETAQALAPPPRDQMLTNLAVAVRKRRRRRGRIVTLAAAVATVVLSVGAVFVAEVVRQDAPTVEENQPQPQIAVNAEFEPVSEGEFWGGAELIAHDAGTEIRLNCGYDDGDGATSRPYWLIVEGVDGDPEVAGSWDVTGNDDAEVTLFSRWSPEEIAAMEIHGEDDYLVLRWER